MIDTIALKFHSADRSHSTLLGEFSVIALVKWWSCRQLASTEELIELHYEKYISESLAYYLMGLAKKYYFSDSKHLTVSPGKRYDTRGCTEICGTECGSTSYFTEQAWMLELSKGTEQLL